MEIKPIPCEDPHKVKNDWPQLRSLHSQLAKFINKDKYSLKDLGDLEMQLQRSVLEVQSLRRKQKNTRKKPPQSS